VVRVKRIAVLADDLPQMECDDIVERIDKRW